jgi:hypothetical protein
MQDLSSLAAGINFGASMAAGNVISDTPRLGGGAGSPSEQTADLPYSPQHNNPELDLGAQEDYTNFEGASADLPPASYEWQYTQGSGR